MKSRLSTLFFLCLTVLSHAQTEDAALDSLIQVYDLEDVVVTAQYAPTSSKNAVHRVKVIKAQDIQRQGLNNLAEVLQNQLNLLINVDPILGNGLKIQGVGGENVQVMIDGVPVIGRRGGNIDLSQINMNNVERIEVIEGAMSAQYGSNAAGGVVNIITKKSQIKKLRVASNNQYEDVGIWNNSLGLGAQHKWLYVDLNAWRNNIDFAPVDSMRVRVKEELENGESREVRKIPWNPKEQIGADATLRISPNDSLNFIYKFRYFDETLNRYGKVNRPQFKPYSYDEIYNTNRTDHSLAVDAYLGDKYYFKTTTAYNKYHRDNEYLYVDFEEDTIGNIIPEQDTSTFTALLHRSILSSTRTGKFNGQVGLELLHETGTGERIVDSTSLPINQAELSNYAAWLGLRYQPNANMTISANLRYGYNSKFDHPLLPSLHVDYKMNKKWRAKFSYAHGYRAPSLKELHFNFIDASHDIQGNTNLLPENSRNISLDWMFDGQSEQGTGFAASVKLFYNSIENRITLAEYAPIQFNYQNLGEFETHGFNLQGEYSLKKDLRIRTGFAFTRLSSNSSEELGQGRFIPLSEWQNELLWTEKYSKISLNITHRFIGRQVRFFYDDDDNLARGSVGDYHLVNATLSRNFWKQRIFIAVGAKNLTDTKDVPLFGSGSGGGSHGSSGSSRLLSWGRTFFVRADFRF